MGNGPVVYLLHLDQPFKHLQHYIGFSDGHLEERLEHHRKGTGANVMRHAALAGITFTLARVWEDADRTFERRLKNTHHRKRLCPICAGERAFNRERRTV